MLLPNGAQIYFAHKRKILVVVFCRFLFRQENALEILLLDKITRKTPMIQYMVKFWLFCRDLGIFSENPTFAQLFWKIHQDFRENMNFGSIRSSSFQPLSSTIKKTGFLGCFLVLLKKAKGKLKDPGKTGWTYPKWWLFLHGDDHPMGSTGPKKKSPLNKQTQVFGMKRVEAAPPKTWATNQLHRPCDLEDSGSSTKTAQFLFGKRAPNWAPPNLTP